MTRYEDTSVGVYRALLRLYPFAFRLEYGEAMERYFRDCCRDARHDGNGAMFSLWAHAFTDLVTNVFKARSVQVIAFVGSTRTYARLGAISSLMLATRMALSAMLELDDTIWNGEDPILAQFGGWFLTSIPLTMIALYLRRGTQPNRLERTGHAITFTGLATMLGLMFAMWVFKLDSPLWEIAMLTFLITLIGFALTGYGRIADRSEARRDSLGVAAVLVGVSGVICFLCSPGLYVPWWGTLPVLLNIAYVSSMFAWAGAWLMLSVHLWPEHPIRFPVLHTT